MDKTELVIQFAHVFHLVTVNLFRLTGFGVFVRYQPGVVIHLWFAVGDNGSAVGGAYRLV